MPSALHTLFQRFKLDLDGETEAQKIAIPRVELHSSYVVNLVFDLRPA